MIIIEDIEHKIPILRKLEEKGLKEHFENEWKHCVIGIYLLE
jgi:hypothetical protein